MNRCVSLVLVLALLATGLSLAACGGGSEGEDPPASSSGSKASQDKPSAKGFTWDDIPVYKGAKKIDQVAPEYIRQSGLEDFEEIGWRYFETTDRWEDVRDFYLEQMPKKGWDKVMAMSFPEGSAISTWFKDDGDTVASVSLGKASDGTVYLTIMRGQGAK